MYTFSRRSLNAVILLALSFFLWPAPRAHAQCMFTNGDFETGDLSGWTVYNRALNLGDWYNYTGTTGPLSGHFINAPPQGSRAATTDQNQATTHVLYQDFTIPAGQSGTLSFYLAYNNTHNAFINLNTLDYVGNQQFRIDLIKPTAGNESIAVTDVWSKFFQTKPGDPLSMSPTLMTFDVSGFAGLTTRLRFAEAVGLNFFLVAVDNVCLSTTRTTITRTTPTGSNVSADFGGVKILFPSVTAAGTTSLTQLDPATVQTGPPAGETFLGPAYTLSTTATTTTPINICMNLPGVTDGNGFNHLRMLQKISGVWVDLATTRKGDFGVRTLCATVTSLTQFTTATNPVVPTAAPATISGSITAADGAPLAGVTINLGGTISRKTITDGNGNYSFENVDTGNFYLVTPTFVNYHFSPESQSFSLVANKTDAVFTAARDAGVSHNPIDTAEYFVRQHYLDFLGREPDESGFNFWSDQILSCGGDADCVERRTINVSAAYFLSIEFQQTGGLVDSLYRASYDRRPSYGEFMPDAASIAQNVIVGRSGWQEQLATNKAAFTDVFVNRPAFHAAYDSLPSGGYIDALVAHTGVNFNPAERNALVSGLNDGSLTRAAALQRIAENQQFANAKRNEMFVMMEYFGYLRRDPDESGYQFWLNKLNEFDGNFERAEMVKAFIVSGEYRDRFPR